MDFSIVPSHRLEETACEGTALCRLPWLFFQSQSFEILRCSILVWHVLSYVLLAVDS